MFKESFEEELQVLIAAREWRRVLELSETLPLEKKNKYLWTWPTAEALMNLQTTLRELNVKEVLSVGCGTGLLEWIIQESIGLSMYGIEVDRSWWESSYSPTSFIKLNFIDGGSMQSDFLQQCCDDYLRLYKGSTLILIGPAPDAGVHTDPAPLTPGFVDSKWRLLKYFNISKHDIIAFYTLS